MILDLFDDLAGYRWSALFDQAAQIHISAQAPERSRERLSFIKRLLDRPEAPQGNADLYFDDGMVLIRRGTFGTLLLFCDSQLNPSLLGFILADLDTAPSHGPNSSSGSIVSSSSGSINVSTRHVLSLHSDSPGVMVPADVVQELIALLTEFLGPLAPKLAQKDARAHNIDLERVEARQWAPLLNLLSERFSEPTKRDKFLDRAVLLKTRF